MSKRHCETCHCGLTHVEWSDRGGWVNLKDPKAIASIIVGCALDHSYDRTGDGIPYGFPDDLQNALAPIVAKHLSAIEPDWKNKTVYMFDKEGAQQAFENELIQVAESVLTPNHQ